MLCFINFLVPLFFIRSQKNKIDDDCINEDDDGEECVHYNPDKEENVEKFSLLLRLRVQRI